MTLNFLQNCKVLLFTFRFLVYLVTFVLLFNEVEISVFLLYKSLVSVKVEPKTKNHARYFRKGSLTQRIGLHRS